MLEAFESHLAESREFLSEIMGYENPHIYELSEFLSEFFQTNMTFKNSPIKKRTPNDLPKKN